MSTDLLKLEYAMDYAWWKYDLLVEQRFEFWSGTKCEEVTQEQIDEQRKNAFKAQQTCWAAYFQENSDQCTCKPDSAIACDVCKAQIKSKSIYREEM